MAAISNKSSLQVKRKTKVKAQLSVSVFLAALFSFWTVLPYQRKYTTIYSYGNTIWKLKSLPFKQAGFARCRWIFVEITAYLMRGPFSMCKILWAISLKRLTSPHILYGGVHWRVNQARYTRSDWDSLKKKCTVEHSKIAPAFDMDTNNSDEKINNSIETHSF